MLRADLNTPSTGDLPCNCFVALNNSQEAQANYDALPPSDHFIIDANRISCRRPQGVRCDLDSADDV